MSKHSHDKPTRKEKRVERKASKNYRRTPNPDIEETSENTSSVKIDLPDTGLDRLELLFQESKTYYTPPKSRIRSMFGLLGVLILFSISIVAIVGAPLTAGAYLAVDTVKENMYAPLPENLKINSYMEKSSIYAVNSTGEPVLLASFYQQDREMVDWDNISQYMKDATLATEDPRYYDHGGIDIRGIIRAAWANITNKEVQQGGSSITQQFIKNSLIQQAEALPTEAEREKAYEAATATSISRKIKEMQYAFTLEKDYSKEQIFTGYLNVVGFGGQIYGVEAASKYYFNVPAKDITLSQAATLTAILNSPNKYRIDKPEQEVNGAADGYSVTKDRRNYVLSKMLEHGYITQQAYDEAVAEEITPIITPSSTGCASAGGSAYFCDYVVNIIKNDPAFGKTPEERENLLTRGGLEIYTTLNLDVQNAALTAMADVPKTSAALELGAAVVSVETTTGRVLAMAQNKNYTQDPEVATNDKSYTAINYNTDFKYGGSSGFQTGSAYKLVTLIEWFKQGKSVYESISNRGIITQAVDSCSPTGSWTGEYKFKNANGGYGSWGSVYYGTQQSLNSTFVGMAEKLDLCEIGKTAKSLGIHRADGNPLFTDPAAVLGTNEVAPLSMAVAYGTVANGGTHCNPIAIDKVIQNGKQIKVPKANCEQVLDSGIAGAVAFTMKPIIDYGFAAAANPRDGIPMFAKTGTTDNAVDSYLVATSTNVSTAMWVGNTIGKVSLQEMTEANGEQIKYPVVKAVAASANSIYGGGEFPAATPELIGRR